MKTVLALFGALAAPFAAAHNLWLEPAGQGGLQALYGEPEIRLSERSPGKLDGIVIVRAEQPKASVVARKDPLAFRIDHAKGHADAWVEARAAAVRRSDANPGGTLALYYARRAAWPLKPTAASMTLDIVPTPEPNTFAVHLNGAPLTQGTMKVIAPSLWLQVHDIDAQGLVRIHTPWRGLYVLDVDTAEQRSGELDGQRYERVVHRATLSFTTPRGPVFQQPRPAQYHAQ